MRSAGLYSHIEALEILLLPSAITIETRALVESVGNSSLTSGGVESNLWSFFLNNAIIVIFFIICLDIVVFTVKLLKYPRRDTERFDG